MPHASGRFLGITVMPEYLQNEGIDAVLDNLVRAGVTAVATSPYVMEPAEEQTGGREPPDDAGAGNVRYLDRPLWGQRALFVRTAPSFVPEKRLYQGLRYQPAEPTELTRREGDVVQRFVRAAQGRHLKVYLQVQAAIPPGYRVQFGGPREEDRPRLPDGRVPPRRLANNGSPASTHIREYTQALLKDLCRAYPDVDGIRVDWPEYPPYFLDDVFLDFSDPAKAAAARLGFDFAQMQTDTLAAYRLLHGGLKDDDLKAWSAADGGRHFLLRTLSQRRGVLDLLTFKAALVDELLAGFRQTLTSAAGERMELMPNAFPPPFTLASGMDFAKAGRHSSAISVKLYTMHWPMMLRFYGDAVMQANPGITEAKLVRALLAWFDMSDEIGSLRLADYAYPETDQPHPVGLEAQVRKIAQAQAEAGSAPVLALAHGYGPPHDLRRRLEAAWRASSHGLWINRYGYLSDEKLAIVGEVCR
jgi:hypothetical protein